MLNWNSIHKATINKNPYPWVFIENLVTPEDILALAASYPQDEFVESAGNNNGYFLRLPVIVTPNDLSQMLKLPNWKERIEQWISQGEVSSNVDDLSEPWQKFIACLQSTDYKAALGEKLGLNLKDYLMRIQFRRCKPGHLGRTPHNDYSPIVTDVTQLIFFNQEWQFDWEGCFCTLANENPDSVVHKVLPMINTSVAIAFSKNSWHMGTPVAPHAPNDRLFLLITYWEPNPLR